MLNSCRLIKVLLRLFWPQQTRPVQKEPHECAC